MYKRTTVMLEEDIYEKLVEESLKRYGSTRALSKVLNELLRESFSGKRKILQLIYSEKIAKTTAKDFEKFRRMLSKRAES